MNRYPQYNPKDEREYIDQIVESMHIDLPAEEEVLARKQMKKEITQELMDEGICPSCGSLNTRSMTEDDLSHGAQQMFQCEGCGLYAN